MLHTKILCEETCEHLSVVLGGCSITCELEVWGEEYDIELGHLCVSEPVAQEFFRGCDVEVDPCVWHFQDLQGFQYPCMYIHFFFTNN